MPGNDRRRLEGKRAVVTGAARGIGRAITRAFAAEGARTILCDIVEDEGRALAAELGEAATFVCLDVRKPDDWSKLAERLRITGVDTLVNNAGGRLSSRELHDVDIDEWSREIDLNLTSVFLGMRTVIPMLLAHGAGSIVNISSISGVVGQPDAPGYQAAKAGVRLLTRNAAVTYAARGIRINSIVPGGIETQKLPDQPRQPREAYFLGATPIGHYGRPEDIANAAVYLASDESAFVTGADLAVDGGFTAR